MCRCVLAFMYGAGCITVAALSSFLDWGVLQVGSSLHHIAFLLMFKVSVGHGLRSGTQKAFLWTPIQVYQNAVLTYSHKPWGLRIMKDLSSVTLSLFFSSSGVLHSHGSGQWPTPWGFRPGDVCSR